MISPRKHSNMDHCADDTNDASSEKPEDQVSESWHFDANNMGVSSFQDQTATFEHYYSPSRAKSLYSKHKELAFDHAKRLRKIAWERKQACAELQKEVLIFEQRKERLLSSKGRRKNSVCPSTAISEVYAVQGRFSPRDITYTEEEDLTQEKANSFSQAKLLRLRKKLRAASAPPRASLAGTDVRIWSADGERSVPRERRQRATPVMLEEIGEVSQQLQHRMHTFIDQIERFKEEYRKAIERKFVKKKVVDENEIRSDGQQLKLNRKMSIRNPYAIFSRSNLLKTADVDPEEASKATAKPTGDTIHEESDVENVASVQVLINPKDNPDISQNDEKADFPQKTLPGQHTFDRPENTSGSGLKENVLQTEQDSPIDTNLYAGDQDKNSDDAKPKASVSKSGKPKRKVSSLKQHRISAGSSRSSVSNSRSVQIHFDLRDDVSGGRIRYVGARAEDHDAKDEAKRRGTSAGSSLAMLKARRAKEEAKPSHLMLAWNEFLEDMHDVERFRKVAEVVTQSKSNHRRLTTLQ